MSGAEGVRPDEILDVILDAREMQTEKRDGWCAAIARDLDCYRVLRVGGSLVGVCKTVRRWLRMGRARIACGEVSWPCVSRRYQRQGYGSILVADALAWMRADGVDISRTTPASRDLSKLYARVGYTPFPSWSTELLIDGFVETPGELDRKIRPFDPGTDLAACVELCDAFSADHMGSLVWTGERGCWSDPFAVVFEEEGRIRGYLRCGSFCQLAHDQESPEVLLAMLRHVSNLAAARGMTTLELRFPRDTRLLQAVMDGGIPFTCSESFMRHPSNMLQILDRRSLFERLGPELTERLRGSAWTGTIGLSTECGTVRLRFDADRVVSLSPGEADISIAVAERDLMLVLFGARSLGEICHGGELSPEDAQLLNALFHRLPVTGGDELWGDDNLDLE